MDEPVNNIVTHSNCYDVKDFSQDPNSPDLHMAYGGSRGYNCDK